MKPEPISKHIVCSQCGLPWDDHKVPGAPKGYEPGLEICVRLLKAELTKRPKYHLNGTTGITQYGVNWC